jgi:CheY-like chemotaxis protein
MKMPVMDGWEFGREYRATYGSAAPILVYTASDDPRRAAREVGAADGLDKNGDLDALLEYVERCLGPA